ncbi:MAG: Lon protease-like protein [Halioglobus sp.]|jgi:Lon protease-like protein
MSELPLFPLSGVLMPFGRMPLQIFEPRYVDLVKDCMKTDSPFGVVWIRRGSEVVERGAASPDLGDFGTCAHIVDFDQLPNGLLGISIEGGERFELVETATRSNGLLVGQVNKQAAPVATAIKEEWRSLVEVLRSLEVHPHVQNMKLRLDYNDAWHVGYGLIQVLPLEEHLKYELLCLDNIDELMDEMDVLLNQISGED